ncbi:MAG: glutamate racemase [Alistipes sp.]
MDKLSNNAPIGVFDSGLGGLTVWREVRRALPAESLVYLGDGANCPYGSRPREEVQALADAAVARLVELDCKMVVVACNTATAAAIGFLREKYARMPIVGMEPAVKPACLATRSGVVGVLATERSLDGELFRRTAARYGSGIEVLTYPGTGFVELVEGDREDTPEAEAAVRAAVASRCWRTGADQIVLGCTHYPFLTSGDGTHRRRTAASRSSTRRPPSPAASGSFWTATACALRRITAPRSRSAPSPTSFTACVSNGRLRRTCKTLPAPPPPIRGRERFRPESLRAIDKVCGAFGIVGKNSYLRSIIATFWNGI